METSSHWVRPICDANFLTDGRMQMRLGLDKSREAQRIPVKYYIAEVGHFKLNDVTPQARRLKSLYGTNRVYLCSDDARATARAKNMMERDGEFEVLVQVPDKSAQSSLLPLLADIFLLGEGQRSTSHADTPACSGGRPPGVHLQLQLWASSFLPCKQSNRLSVISWEPPPSFALTQLGRAMFHWTMSLRGSSISATSLNLYIITGWAPTHCR